MHIYFLAVVLTVVSGTIIFDAEGYSDHHNFGYLFQRRQRVYLSSGEAQVVFHYRLPDRMNTSRVGPVNCRSMMDRPLHCARTQYLIQLVSNVKRRTMSHLKLTLDHIYDVIADLSEPKRRKRGWWSYGWSAFTGLAETTDLNKITEFLQKVELGMSRAVESWETGSSGFITALEAERKRVDSIHNVLELQKQSILSLQREIANKYYEQVTFSRLIVDLMTNHLAPMFASVADADFLYQSIQLLNAGILPHHFISHAKLRTAFIELERNLRDNHPNLTILIRDPSFYYYHPKFQTFRHQKFLIIILSVPLTTRELRNEMDLLYLQKVPLLIPHDVSHYSILKTDFTYVISSPTVNYYLQFESKPEFERGSILKLGTNNVILRRLDKVSCATALLQAHMMNIRQECGYWIKPTPLTSEIFHLGNHLYLFSNIQSISLECIIRDNGTFRVNNTRIDLKEYSQRVYTAPCDCSITADYFKIPVSLLHCDAPSVSLTGQHLLNLAFLSHFFDEDLIRFAKSDTLFNKSIDAELPQLPIVSSEYQEELRIQEDRKFDMEVAVNHSKENRDLYHSLSHYIYSKLLLAHTDTSNFDPMDWLTWIAMLALLLAVVAFVAVIRLSYRLQAIYAMSALRLPTTSGQIFPTRFTYTTPSTLSYNKSIAGFQQFQDWLTNFIPVELTILCILLLLIILIIGYFIYSRIKKGRDRTEIFLEVTDGQDSVQIKLLGLHYAPDHYSFQIARNTVDIQLTQGWIMSTVTLLGDVRIMNSKLGLHVPVPTNYRVCSCTGRKFHKLLQTPHCITLLILNWNSVLVDIVLLRSLYTPALKLTGQSVQYDHGTEAIGLYPTLPQN